MSWQQRIDNSLTKRWATQTLRVRSPVNQGAGRWLRQGNARWLNFSSNDYLGLSQHPHVVGAWQRGAVQYGIGSGGSGHLTGYSVAHQLLEEALANWLGYSRALLFISGFSANQAVISALMQKDDRIIADKLSHASLLEAARLSPAELRRFMHNDVEHLQILLGKSVVGQQLVVTEGIFSMDGDSAPLADIIARTHSANSWLMVDDAHGIGVSGNGCGSCAAQGVKPELLIITFGKAFGLSGAAVLCSDSVADYLLQFARHLIYSTSMPPAQAVALRESLAVVMSEEGDARRQVLRQHIARFRQGARQLGWQLTTSEGPIQPLIVGENEPTVALAEHLRQQGYWLSAIRPPTVPIGTARLRITLTAAHEKNDIYRLLEVLDAARQ